MNTGVTFKAKACSTWPSAVANMGNSKKRADSASEATATSAPKVSTVQ